MIGPSENSGIEIESGYQLVGHPVFQSKKPLYASIMPERTALLQGDVNLHARAHI